MSPVAWSAILGNDRPVFRAIRPPSNSSQAARPRPDSFDPRRSVLKIASALQFLVEDQASMDVDHEVLCLKDAG